MTESKKITKYLQHISLFAILFFDSSFVFSNSNNGFVVIMLNIIACLVLIFINKKLHISKNKFIFLVILLLMVSINGFLYENIKQTIILLILIFVAFIISILIDYNKFKDIYLKFMLFLSIFSIITFGISMFFPQLISFFPVVLRNVDNVNVDYLYHNMIFSIVSTNKYLMRNYGFFWEPGAFSIFLNIALLFEIFNKNINWKRVLLFLITVLTTFSTLGIICSILLLLCLLIKHNYGNKNVTKVKIIIIILAVVAIIYLFINGDYFIYHVFGKLQKNSSNSYNMSTLTRYNALIIPLKNFINNPLFGIGFNNYLTMQLYECYNMATCTFANWLCIFGIFGLLPIISSLKFFMSFGKSFFERIILLVFSLIIFSTENFLQISFIYIIIFYGFELFFYKGDFYEK